MTTATIRAFRACCPGRWWQWEALIRVKDETRAVAVVKGLVLYHRKRDALRAGREVMKTVWT